MTDTEKLKRYYFDYPNLVMREATNGAYVMASEADALIASLRSALLAAEQERDAALAQRDALIAHGPAQTRTAEI